MSAPTELHIPKLDAAKRQMEVAIRLYFSWGDPVAIHTLAAAAFNVLIDINDHRGGKGPPIREKFLDWIKPGHLWDAKKKLKEAENFFKHADRDPGSTLPFRPQATEFVLFDGVELYFGLTQELPPLLQTYRAWWLIQYKHILMPDAPESLRKVLTESRFDSSGRATFFQQMLPVVSQANGRQLRVRGRTT